MDKRYAEKGRKSTMGREKVQMAWRHKSRGEKHLLMVIAFLVFALLCFIIAVISMNFAFKSKIQNLEDEIHDLKTETPISTITPESTTTEKLVTTSTTMTPTPTTTPTSATTAETTATTMVSSTASPTMLSAEGEDSGPISETTSPTLLLDALRALLFNFSGMTTSMKTIDKTTHRGSITSRSHGTILIMADINHEESVTSMPDLPEPNVEEDPLVYIDTNGTSALPMNGTTSLESASHFDDTEDDDERTADDILEDLERVVNLEGSGASEDTGNP